MISCDRRLRLGVKRRVRRQNHPPFSHHARIPIHVIMWRSYDDLLVLALFGTRLFAPQEQPHISPGQSAAPPWVITFNAFGVTRNVPLRLCVTLAHHIR